MLLINKKRIQIIISCVLVGMLAFSFKIANEKDESTNDNNLEQSNIIQTTATPVSGKTIVVDARAWGTR